jgi:Asp-tRNA(Asn)/Glu-tRNA(Gln) amidotransferase A subunit family amidase
MARSVADCAALLEAMASGPAEPTPLFPPPAPMGELPLAARPGPRPLEGLTIARIPPPSGVELDHDVADGVDKAAEACRRLGAEVVDAERVAEASLDDFYLITGIDAWSYHEQHASRGEHYRPFLAAILDAVREAGPAAEYVRAQARRAELAGTWERWMAESGVDLLLEATSAFVPPLREVGYPERLPSPDPLLLLTFAWDMTGFPAVALPAGLGSRSGLPVGVSLIAPRGAEPVVVQAAIDLQEHELEPPVLS